MGETLLYTLKPILDFVPEVSDPKGRIQLKDKILWTGITLFLYLVCSQIPLYGIFRTADADPLYWMRVILASNRGTLMELGISPLITSNMIIELVANAKLITYDANIPQDKRLLAALEKVLSIIVSFGTAFAYVFAGMYGSIAYIGPLKAFLLIIQLTTASILVLYLDEMLQKGYGIGSGTSLFIATNICENIFWKSFSPVTVRTENGIEFEGAFIALFHFLITKPNKMTALYLAFYRSNLVNLHHIVATVFVFFVVIYFQGFQVNLRLESHQVRGATSTYPIKLFYLSNTPIILQTALISNLHTMSNLLYKKFGGFFLVRLLGIWKQNATSGQDEVVGGLAYYLVPPSSIYDVVNNPGHFVIYLTVIVVSCALFSKFWLELSGRDTKTVVRQIKEGNMIIAGNSRSASMLHYLNKQIPIAAVLGGVCIALLSVFSDLLGAVGSGTGILLAVNIIYGFYETYKKESNPNENFLSAVEF
jgi:protein transport protein SEC61 subunit alpha